MELDKIYSFIKSYTNSDAPNLIYDIENSHSVYLVDRLTKTHYLDCCSFFASNPLGFNHPKMNDPEFEKLLLKVAKIKPCNADFFTEEYSNFLETFLHVAVPKDFKNLFFIEGGTLGVENALKAAFDWKIRKLLDRDEITDVNSLDIIHFNGSFHGRSGYSISITKTTDPRKVRFFPKFKWTCIQPPIDLYCDTDLEQIDKNKLNDLEYDIDHSLHELTKILEQNKVAAIIIEPIQSEGGNNFFPPRFHKCLRDLANEYEAMLIYDEIQTGIGITGKMWAYEHYNIVPDILVFGKKTQISGFMCTNRIHEVDSNVFIEPLRLDSTFGGNLTDMVRASQYLKIIQEDKLVINADLTGAYLLDNLTELKKKCRRKYITDVRGLGLLCAFDMPSKEIRDKFIKICFQNKLLVLKCGSNGIRFRPPLIFTEDDVDVLIEKLNKSLKEII